MLLTFAIKTLQVLFKQIAADQWRVFLNIEIKSILPNWCMIPQWMFHSKASNDFPPLNRLRFLLFQCWSGIFQTMWYYPGDWIQIYCNPYAYMRVHTFSIHIKEPVMLSLTRDNQFERFVNNFTQAGGVGRTWRNRVDFTFLILTAFKIQRSNVIIVLKFYQATVSCARYLETKATMLPV